ncbi:probable cytokinin riboside 5'-monophosphate phosphoribohydrolase LOGL8 [Citrus clementina]|uniref:probable cytokinin riboside 5'-monophosphate phosphoribohydrolase LOGL8 n=1 Tax=Citrus clementina TaxID=85681 RepID=UPI000CED3918|nr:probable cytokinin riboside 5'-monophosphate phosphoribohydrolase LOGL8 [Citrus x clementina]
MRPPYWSLRFKLMCDASDYGVGVVLGQRKEKRVRSAVIDLGHAIVERKLHLVYGGGDRELSKLVSEAAFVRGSQVLGIIPKALKPLGCLPYPPTGEELVVSGDLATLEALIAFAS